MTIIEDLRTVEVFHEKAAAEGWHRYTSPQLPGLLLTVQTGDLQEHFDDLPIAIAELIRRRTGRKVVAKTETDYEYHRTHPRERLVYTINNT